jgi:hypothetical protein
MREEAWGRGDEDLSIDDMSLKLSLPDTEFGFRSAFFVSTVSDSTEATYGERKEERA